MDAMHYITLWFQNDAGLYGRGIELTEESETKEKLAEALENEVDSILETALESQSGFVADIVNNAIAKITHSEWMELAEIFWDACEKDSEDEGEELNEGD